MHVSLSEQDWARALVSALCLLSGAQFGCAPTDDAAAGYCDLEEPAAEGVLLPVASQPQVCSQWCWATTLAMVANYYGRSDVTPCGIVSAFDQADCCVPYACQTSCNHPGPPDILPWLGLSGIHLMRALTEDETQLEMTNGRPIIVHFAGPQVNHVIIVNGFVPASSAGPALYRIIDPLNWSDPWASGVHPYIADLPYQALSFGPDGQSPWIGTYLRLSPREDGCSPVTNPDCECRT